MLILLLFLDFSSVCADSLNDLLKLLQWFADLSGAYAVPPMVPEYEALAVHLLEKMGVFFTQFTTSLVLV